MSTNSGSSSTITRKRYMLLIAALAGLTWAGLVGLIFMLNTGQYDFWFPGRIVVYVLLLVAPALTFMPIGRVLEFPLYGYWSVVSFVIFGYVLAFVPSDPDKGWGANAGGLSLLLLSLFMVTVTIFLPIFYRLGFKLFSRKVEQYDLSRARREAVLAGLCVLLLAFLRMVGALNLLIAFAMVLAFIVFEMLILSRNYGRV